MRCFYVTFRSVTFAQRGEQVLEKGGIRCSLQRTPKWMEERGCGYSLRFWTNDLNYVMALLRQERVLFKKLYAQLEDGTLEELTL